MHEWSVPLHSLAQGKWYALIHTGKSSKKYQDRSKPIQHAFVTLINLMLMWETSCFITNKQYNVILMWHVKQNRVMISLIVYSVAIVTKVLDTSKAKCSHLTPAKKNIHLFVWAKWSGLPWYKWSECSSRLSQVPSKGMSEASDDPLGTSKAKCSLMAQAKWVPLFVCSLFIKDSVDWH